MPNVRPQPAQKPGLFARVLGAVGLGPRRSAGPARAVYAGAAYNRMTEDWFAQILSADLEIKYDLRRLRGASRALVRDNSYATRFVNMIAENVVGAQGIRLQARLRTSRDDLHTRLNQQVEDGWERWGEPEQTDVAGQLSWVEFQQLVMRTIPQDGEAVVRIIRGADNDFAFALQLLDADQLDETYNVGAGKGPNGNEVIMGVEVNRFGKPLGYWLWTEHPSEFGKTTRKRERVPADDILHLYLKLRPGQTRGVPWFAPILVDQKMLQGYQEAEITAARMGASNVAAITIPDAEKYVGSDDNAPPESYVPTEIEPGQVWRLNPGEALQGTDFNHPNTAFGPFTKSILRSIATGLNVAYTSLTGDLEAVNYSSIRAGLLSERDFYRGLQAWVSTHLHRRVFRAWVPFAALAGEVPATANVDPRKVRWLPRGWKWVDPRNDVEAAVLARQHGFTTSAAICAENGGDFEENLEAIADENALADELGVVLPSAAPSAVESAVTAAPGAADETTAPPAKAARVRRAQRALHLTRAADA